MINMALLYRGLHLANVYKIHTDTIVFVMKLVVSGAIMSVCLYMMLSEMTHWLIWGIWERGLRLAGLIIAGALVYLISGDSRHSLQAYRPQIIKFFDISGVARVLIVSQGVDDKSSDRQIMISI